MLFCLEIHEGGYFLRMDRIEATTPGWVPEVSAASQYMMTLIMADHF